MKTRLAAFNVQLSSGTWPVFVGCLLILKSCAPAYQEDVDSMVLQPAPVFNADSAYANIAAQVGFGPRIPGTETHTRCGDFLVSELTRHGAQVAEQLDSATVAGGLRLPIRNIIASFFPEKETRILLVAHWDSRPMADMDTVRKSEPIDGAHDGASGVGVLLEVARILGQQQPNVGVDIILFDTEDQGRSWKEGDTPDSEFFFCMGSRHWATHPHEENYTARYAILLDMVAAEGAQFTLEQNSMKYAEPHTRNAWTIAHKLGYGDLFRFNLTRSVQHDHYFLSTEAKIPTLAIMHHDNSTYSGYAKYWHTHHDNLTSVDAETLKAVGQTVIQTLFNEAP